MIERCRDGEHRVGQSDRDRGEVWAGRYGEATFLPRLEANLFLPVIDSTIFIKSMRLGRIVLEELERRNYFST